MGCMLRKVDQGDTTKHPHNPAMALCVQLLKTNQQGSSAICRLRIDLPSPPPPPQSATNLIKYSYLWHHTSACAWPCHLFFCYPFFWSHLYIPHCLPCAERYAVVLSAKSDRHTATVPGDSDCLTMDLSSSNGEARC